MARIMPEVAQRQARTETIDDRRRGGALSKLAGQFCEAEPFRKWLRLTYEPLPRTSTEAAEIIRSVCRVESRAELDHDDDAAAIFHREFRLPYNEWLKDGNA